MGLEWMDGWMDIPNLDRTEPEAWLAGWRRE
jgi:hypothetical protein